MQPIREQLLERTLAWARSRPDILAICQLCRSHIDHRRAELANALVGSAARAEHPADEWSHLDLIMVATDPLPYLSSDDWAGAIGEPWVSTVERAPGGDVRIRT